MNNGKWVKLGTGNDWGTVYYSHEPLDEFGMASTRRATNFQEGQEVRVRWPDGTLSTEKLTIRKFYNDISDHGKDSKVPYKLAVIDKTVFGLQKTFLLSEVEIWEES